MSKTDYRAQFDLGGRVAVITGGAGVLGREFAAGLAQHGAQVALLDIDGDRVRQAASEIETDSGRPVRGYACDVTDPGSVAVAFNAIAGDLARVDVVVNNAQSVTRDYKKYFAPFESYDFAEWRRVLSVDLDGMAIVAQAACRMLVAQGQGGALIQIGSIYGGYGPDNRIYDGAVVNGVAINNPAVYSAGKAGVLGLTRWLATSYAGAGIRSNAIIPGGVQGGQNEEFVARYANRVPMGRMARQDEVVGACVWLASGASSYVTGQCIYVDGGLSAW